MSKMKKIVSLLMCIVMLLSFSGCSLLDSALVKSVKAMNNLNSFHADISAEVSGSINVMESSHELELEANAEGNMILSPLSFGFVGSLAGNEALPSLSVYGSRQSDSLEISVGTGDTYTDYSVAMSDSGKSLKLTDVLEFIASGTLFFTEKGIDEINGSEAVRYDGTVSESTLKLLLSYAGLENTDNISGRIPVSLWIDTTSYMIVRLDADLSEIAPGIGKMISDSISVTAFGKDIPVNVEIGSANISILFSDFNGIESIAFPESV